MTWLQYTTVDGMIQATCSNKVGDDDLSALGRAQIEYDGSFDGMMVDVTQTPHVVIPIPPFPAPAG